jgi:hypothetical protein
MAAVPPECAPPKQQLDGIEAEIRALNDRAGRRQSRREADQHRGAMRGPAGGPPRSKLDTCISGAGPSLDVVEVERTQAIQLSPSTARAAAEDRPTASRLSPKLLLIRV